MSECVERLPLEWQPCSRGTHNEAVKNLFLFSSIIVASNLNPLGVFSILESNQRFYHIYTLAIVIHKSRNLIGTVGIAKFRPKWGQVFQSNVMGLC